MKTKYTNKGSLTVEALLFLIPFMLAFLTILNAGRFVQTEMLIHHAITQTAKQISAYGYVATKTGITKRMQATKGKSDKFQHDTETIVDDVRNISNSIGNFPTSGNIDVIFNAADKANTDLTACFSDPNAIVNGAMSYLKRGIEKEGFRYLVQQLSIASIKNALWDMSNQDVNKYLENVGLVDGLSGLHFDKTSFDPGHEGKGEVKIVVTYTMKNLIFPQFDFGQYEFRQCASTLMW